MPPKAKANQPPREPVFVRTETYEGFTSGAPVRLVGGFLASKRGYRWEFRFHVRNPVTGSEWLELYGGSRTDPYAIRAFKIEDVELIVKKKKRGSE